MKAGWKIENLGAVCEILDNKRKPITKKNRVEGQIPYYGATGILSYVNGFLFDEPLVLLGEDGAKWESGDNSAFSIKGKTWVNNHAHVLRPNRAILDDNWLIYNLNFQNLMPFVSGMTVPKLNQGNMRKIPIPIPPLSEQKQIVAILDQAFEAIDQAKANIEKNIENAKELFENWTYQTIENSNWPSVNWGQVCDFIRGPFGGSLKKSMFVDSGYAVYEQKQAIHNDYDALKYFISEHKFQEMKRFEVHPKDLLMSCSGVTLGRISEVPENAPKGIINQALLKLRTKPNHILNDFLVIWIRSKEFQNLIFKFAGGAAQPNVPGVKVLKAIKVPCPSVEEQQEFVELHDKMKELLENSISAYSRKIEFFENLKKSLLQKAFSGELTSETVINR